MTSSALSILPDFWSRSEPVWSEPVWSQWPAVAAAGVGVVSARTGGAGGDSQKMKLTAATRRVVVAAHQALTADAEVLREVWDDRSEAWQDSERGADADNWLSELEAAADALGEVALEPDGETVENQA